jgi:hypothetical protein
MTDVPFRLPHATVSTFLMGPNWIISVYAEGLKETCEGSGRRALLGQVAC